MSKIIEGNMSKKDLDFITHNIVNSDQFPWYYLNQPVSQRYPCFSHVMIPRYDYKKNEGMKINSGFYSLFEKIFLSFCKKNKIKVNRILRSGLNLQTYFNPPFGDPHVDHEFKHKNCIMYINNVTGWTTYVFEEKYKKNLPGSYGDGTAYNAKNVLKEIKSKAGKIVVFPGENFHAAGHCRKPNERRIVAVFTFN